MIKLIQKCLKENASVSDWLISENTIVTSEAFYVLQKLETTRITNTTEYVVTIYNRYTENEKSYLGDATFVVSHKLSKKEVNKLIDEALYSAKFVRNPDYKLVVGDKKKSWKEKDYELAPFELTDKIAGIFFEASSEGIRFNALEVFVKKVNKSCINSQGVNLKKTVNSVMIEAIPSYDGENENVELYKQYNYKNIDFAVIKEEAKKALDDVKQRYYAKKLPAVKNYDIIIKDLDVAELFKAIVDDTDYASKYNHSNTKEIGDMVQKDATGDLLNITLAPESKADAFDGDGFILKSKDIIVDGKLVSSWGSNRYACYLNMEPTGLLSKIVVKKGSKSIEKMKKTPHLEIIALSGIQVELYSDYIGGEVRLATYFDGENEYSVSGFSFSGSLESVLKNLELSKELVDINDYNGPKYIKLKNVDVL